MGGYVRVLIVSMGALEKGPIAPEMRPITMCWYEGSTCRSGCCWSANFLSSWYVVKFAPACAISAITYQRRDRGTHLGSSPAAGQ